MYGWVEYRISHDNGRTYSEVYDLPYSKEHFLEGDYTISVEKAIACDNGTIVAICLRNTMETPLCCEPWLTPMYIRSLDGGKSWSEPLELSPYSGRPYDAVYRDGCMYVLHSCNEHFLGTTEEHKYRIYKSNDNGLTFEELCVIPFNTLGRSYGSIIFDAAGSLHAYAYNVNSEREMDHAVSHDNGKTWSLCEPCYLAKGIRNPQTALLDGIHILHGRAENTSGFVFYSSTDGYTWDEGIYLIRKEKAYCFYSNNINLRDEKGNFLLVQYSDTYSGAKVNVMHMRVRIRR